MRISMDIFSIILIIGAVQGFFIALILLNYKKENKIANNLLGLHIALFSLGIFIPEAIHLYPQQLAFLINSAFPLMFLFGPTMYLYALFITRTKQTLQLKDALHLAPFVLSIFYLLPFYLLEPIEKFEIYTSVISNGLPMEWIIGWALECLHIAVYLLLTFQLLITYHKKIRNNYSNIDKKNLTWLMYLVLGNEAIWSIYFFRLIIATGDTQFDLYGFEYYLFGISISIFVYVIGFKGLKQPDVLLNNIIINGDDKKKYERSGLTKTKADEYMERLLEFMNSQKPYQQNDITLRELAEQTEMLPNHLSQLVNDRLNKNFFDFINSYRIKEAKELLVNRHDQSVLQIAFEVGFNSKSTFNTAFKKHTGTTPTAYRKSTFAA